MAARHDVRARAARRGRRARLRHRRQLAGVAPERSRIHVTDAIERLAHDAVRHPPRRLGRRAAAHPRHSARRCCRRCCPPRTPSACCRAGAARRGGPDRRHRGRPAGGAVRPGLPPRRDGEEHLRHRLLHAAAHGRARGALGQRAGDDRLRAGRLCARRARRRQGIRARRQRLRRRRSGAVAARRDRNHSNPPARSSGLRASVPDNGGVFLVPAFTGLGAPHWDPFARGAILGLTRGSSRGAHRARRARSRSPSRVADVLEAMQKDAERGARPSCASTAAPPRTTC